MCVLGDENFGDHKTVEHGLIINGERSRSFEGGKMEDSKTKIRVLP